MNTNLKLFFISQGIRWKSSAQFQTYCLWNKTYSLLHYVSLRKTFKKNISGITKSVSLTIKK